MPATEYTVAILIKAIDQATDDLKKTGKYLGDLGKEAYTTSKKLRPLGIALTAVGAAGTALIASSTLLAARAEVLGTVLGTIGENAGYTETELLAFEQAVTGLNITTISARQAMVQMIQAEIDLESATTLARVAQDAAVIANLDSSETFERLIHVIQVGIPRMARALGINANFAQSYRELAAELGKSTDELTRQELQQARVNEIVRASAAIQGTYEAAMQDVGKQMLSLKREWVETRTIIGNYYLPALSQAVAMIQDMNDAFQALEPTEQKARIGLLSVATAIGTLGGAAILLTPRLVMTGQALGSLGMLAVNATAGVKLVAGGFSVAEVASLGLAGTLGAVTTVFAALLPAMALAYAAYVTNQRVVEGQIEVQSALREELERGIAIQEDVVTAENLTIEQRQAMLEVQRQVVEGEGTATDVADQYFAARRRINEVLEGTPAILRGMVEGQNDLNVSQEELNELLLKSAINYAEYIDVARTLGLDVIPQETDALAEASAMLEGEYIPAKEELLDITLSELEFYQRRNELVDGAIRADRLFVAGLIGISEATEETIQSAEELNEALRAQHEAAEAVTDQVEEYEEYLSDLGDLEAQAAQEMLDAQEGYAADLEEILDSTREDILTGEQELADSREEVVADGLVRLEEIEEDYGEARGDILQDTRDLLLDYEDQYNKDRERSHQDALDAIAEAEEDAADARADIIADTEEALADLRTDYLEDRATAEADAQEDFIEAEQEYNDRRAEVTEEGEEALLNAQEDYLKSREQAMADYEKSLLRSEEDYQYGIADVTEDANEDVADIEDEYANRQYELVQSSAQEIAWFRAKAAAKEARLQSRVLLEANATQRAALEAQLEQLQISNAETLTEMQGHEVLISGIEREEADERIARVREREEKRLEALEEAWEKQKRRLARQQEDKLAMLEEKWAEEQASLAERTAERLEDLDESWVKEQVTLAEREEEKLETLEEKWEAQKEALAKRAEERQEAIDKRYDDEIERINEREEDKLADLQERWDDQKAAAAEKETERLQDLLDAYEEEKTDLADAQEKKLTALEEAWGTERTALIEKEKKDLDILETSWTAQQKDLEKAAKKRLTTLEKSWAGERKKLEEHYAKERIQFIDHKIALLETIDDRTEAQDDQLDHLREVREEIGREYGLWDDASLETARMTDLITAAVDRMNPVAWAALMHEWDMALSDGVLSSEELEGAVSGLDTVSREVFLTQFPNYRRELDQFGGSVGYVSRKFSTVAREVRAFTRDLNKIPDEINIVITTTGGGYQHGTAAWPGGAHIVGEGGPELAVMPRGTKVYPNWAPQTRDALAGGGGSAAAPVIIYNTFTADSVRTEEDIEKIASAIQESMSLRGVRATI